MSAAAVCAMREAGRLWVVEELDKNSAELSFTCTQAWALLTYETFQYWPPGVWVAGMSGTVRGLGGLRVCSGSGIHMILPVATKLRVTSWGEVVSGDAGDLAGWTAAVTDFCAMVRAEGGDNFDYSVGFPYKTINDWIKACALIPGIDDDIQPASLEKRFSGAVRAQRGKRCISMPSVRRLPKNKDLLLSRPIGDQSCAPWATLNTLVGRLLDLCDGITGGYA